MKEQVLEVQNPHVEGIIHKNSMIDVPIRYACPDGSDRSNGTKYLVTYPVAQNDNISVIAFKFNVSGETIWYVNSLESHAP